MMSGYKSVMSRQELHGVCEELRLAPRQRDIAGCLLRGMSDKQIAQTIGISLPTVRTHLSRMFEKFKVTDRTQLVLRFVHVFREAHCPIGDGHPHRGK